MALPTPTFAHLFDSLTPNYPTSGLTKSNPAGHTDPSVSGNVATFGTGSGGVGVSWAWSGGNFLTGGTSDWTIACRFKITSSFSNGVWMMTVGDGGRYLSFSEKSSVNLNLRAYVGGIAAETYTTNSAFAVDTTFTLVAKRTSGAVTIWVNGSNVTAVDGITTTNLNAASYNDVSLGALPDGSDNADGTMEFAAIWDSAIDDADIAALNATTLRASFGGGGGPSNAPRAAYLRRLMAA